MRRARDPVAFFRALERAPFAHDFYSALRQIECLFPDRPRLGAAARPADEPVRLGQEPALDFAPATLSALTMQTGSRAPRLAVRFLGLLGSNGPLPLHLTEYARQRMMHVGDHTLVRFLDLVNHRFIAMFYRAWAQAQPTVDLDRVEQDRFAIYVGALEGIGSASLRRRDVLPEPAKLFFAGLLGRQVRNRDGLEAVLCGFFRVPVRIEEFVGHWMTVPDRDRARLGSRAVNAALGRGAVIGREVWDRQYRIRVHLGPVTLAQYESFLPGGHAIEQLVAWLRTYLGRELASDVRLALRRSEVPRARLGAYGRLGWSTWVGERRERDDARDLTLDPEALLADRGANVRFMHVAMAADLGSPVRNVHE